MTAQSNALALAKCEMCASALVAPRQAGMLRRQSEGAMACTLREALCI